MLSVSIYLKCNLFLWRQAEFSAAITNRSVIYINSCSLEQFICTNDNLFSVEGPLGCTWSRHYCTYEKGTKMFTMSNSEFKSGGKQVLNVQYLNAIKCLISHCRIKIHFVLSRMDWSWVLLRCLSWSPASDGGLTLLTSDSALTLRW